MMRRFLISLLLVLCSVIGLTQEFTEEQHVKIAHYNDILEDPNSHDTALAAAYSGLLQIYFYSDEEVAMSFADKAISIAEKGLMSEQPDAVSQSFNKSMIQAISDKGSLYSGQHQAAKSIELFQRALILRRQIGDKRGIAETMTNMSVMYTRQGNLAKAHDMLKESLAIVEEINDEVGIGMVLVNLADLNTWIQDTAAALDYYQRAMDQLEPIQFNPGLVKAYAGVGAIHEKRGELKEAKEYLEKALDISLKYGLAYGTYASYNGLGKVHGQLGDHKKELEYFTKYQEAANEHEHPGFIIQGMILRSTALLHLAQSAASSPQERLQSLQSAENIASEATLRSKELGDITRQFKAYEILYLIYSEKGDFEKAFEAHQAFIVARDKLKSKENQERFANAKIEAEFERQKIQEDIRHLEEVALLEAKEERQKLYTYGIAGGLGMTAIFLGLIFNRLQVTKRQKVALHQQKEVIEAAHKEITDSIKYAKRIQAAVLPSDALFESLLPTAFVLYKPKDIVAGDFYWLEEKAGKIYFAAADCTGHGVPGAMVSVVCNNGLNRSVRELGLTDPGQILDNTRDIVIKEFDKSADDVKDGMDIALCVLEGKTLHYAGAHNPLWLIRKGELLEFKADKQAIGKQDNPTPFTSHTIELQDGDSIYLFSDGYVDQFGGEKGKKYKSIQLKETLIRMAKHPISDQKELLNREFEQWRGDLEQIDDVCVIGMKV